MNQRKAFTTEKAAVPKQLYKTKKVDEAEAEASVFEVKVARE